jgi:hypothetical protein
MKASQQNAGPNFSPKPDATALVLNSCAELMFLLSTYAYQLIDTKLGRIFSRFLLLRRLWHGSGGGATLVLEPQKAVVPARVDNY